MTRFTKDLTLLGTDLGLEYRTPTGTYEDADLSLVERRSGTSVGRRDASVVADVEAAVQFIANRLKTQRGELAALGHPEYGSRHHELIGEPNVERTRSLIKLYVLEALRNEPRIEETLACEVFAPHSPPRSEVRIVIDAAVIGHPVPLNLVIPFNLETSP